MENGPTVKTTLILFIAAVSTAVLAEPNSPNRLSVAVRFGYNVKAGFNYGIAPVGKAPATTPDGAPYNYDDGYVLRDASGNAGGQTWYWGYDNSAQVVGNAILMSTTTMSGSSGNQKMDGSRPTSGIDLTYSHEFISQENLHFGLDFTLGFMPMIFEDLSTFSPVSTTTTDHYGFTGGSTPPSAPYQGTYNGPGFLIDSTPSSTTTTTAPGALVLGYSKLDALLWTFRIGPYLEFPVNDQLSLGLSGGMSLGWLNVDANWNLSGAVNDYGRGSDSDTLYGDYLGGQLIWRINEDWRFLAGADFENLTDWKRQFGTHTARLDFSRGFYTTFGVQREF